jgi:hypothetical protein
VDQQRTTPGRKGGVIGVTVLGLLIAAAVVLFVVTPISVLVGGLWSDYGTRTTGARQNATF